MNPAEKRFREVFGPFLENQGYQLKYGTYVKIDCEHFLIKQVFIRTISRQWQVCARLASFYHYLNLRKAEVCSTYFISMDDIEEDKNTRGWLISLPGKCHDNYAKWNNVPKEEADVFLKESVIKHIDYQFQLFQNKVFDLLDSPRSLSEGCANIKALMELITTEPREWFDEIDLARIYFFDEQKEAALNAIDHYFARWDAIYNRRREFYENNGGRYRRWFKEHGEEWFHWQDAERSLYFQLRKQIEADDGEENFNIVTRRIIENALNMLNCKLISKKDYERIEAALQAKSVTT